MKTLEEIKASGKVLDVHTLNACGLKFIAGQIYDRKERIHFTLGFNENGWEHVAISVGSGRKPPSWAVMCKAKEVFWHDDEDVVQLHPKESEYFHGFPNEMEVLHLWRPANGDWSLLNSIYRHIQEGGNNL